MARSSVTASMIQSQACKLRQIVVEVSGRNAARADAGVVERSRLCLQQRGDAPLAMRVRGFASAFAGRNNIEQQDGDAGIGQMRGDARAHGSGSENSGAAQKRRGGMDWNLFCDCGADFRLP